MGLVPLLKAHNFYAHFYFAPRVKHDTNHVADCLFNFNSKVKIIERCIFFSFWETYYKIYKMIIFHICAVDASLALKKTKEKEWWQNVERQNGPSHKGLRGFNLCTVEFFLIYGKSI